MFTCEILLLQARGNIPSTSDAIPAQLIWIRVTVKFSGAQRESAGKFHLHKNARDYQVTV